MNVFTTNRMLRVIVGLGLLIMPLTYVIAVSTNTGALPTSANVDAFCTITSGELNFGTYDPLIKNSTQSLDETSTFDITCTKGSSATIGLNEGNNASHASGTSRALSAGGSKPDYISYELYLNASRTTVWNMTNVVPYVASNNRPRKISVYGRIPAGQDVGAGYYSDTVLIRANF